jgi:hypothetical protein
VVQRNADDVELPTRELEELRFGGGEGLQRGGVELDVGRPDVALLDDGERGRVRPGFDE